MSISDIFKSTLEIKEETVCKIEESDKIEQSDLEPGSTFFALSKDGKSLSKFKVTGQKEFNVGPVLQVKHSVIAGDKFKQSVISKDFVLGTKGSLQIFKNRKDAMSAYKKGGILRKAV